MEDLRRPSRKKFLKTLIAGSLLPSSSVSGCARFDATGDRQGTGSAAGNVSLTGSRVIIARDPKLRDRGTGVDSNRLLKLLDVAMQTALGCDSPIEAWHRVVRPGEVVGLKVNCLAGKGISTSVPLVETVCQRLQEAGIAPKNILIWDRLNADLERAGYRIASDPGRIRCLGNDVLGYEEDLSIHGSVGSLVAKSLTRVCDAVISLPVLKDHGIVGVTMALKNFFGAIHNPNKYHLNSGDPYVADVYMLPPIRQKVRLTICDATTAQYEGGPSYMPHWTWPFNGLLISGDPVAMDYTGWQIIEQKRVDQGIRSLQEAKRAPGYITTAADSNHRLGTNDPNRIERIEV